MRSGLSGEAARAAAKAFYRPQVGMELQFAAHPQQSLARLLIKIPPVEFRVPRRAKEDGVRLPRLGEGFVWQGHSGCVDGRSAHERLFDVNFQARFGSGGPQDVDSLASHFRADSITGQN